MAVRGTGIELKGQSGFCHCKSSGQEVPGFLEEPGLEVFVVTDLRGSEDQEGLPWN